MTSLQYAVAVPVRTWPGVRVAEAPAETENRRSARWLPAVLSCAPVGIRTPNLLIRSQMLYPLSYGRTPTAVIEPRDRTRIADRFSVSRIASECHDDPASTPHEVRERGNRYCV